MFNSNAWGKTKSLRLIALGVVVHISLYFGALDVYFSSPVEPGLMSFKTNFTLADRVVVFIADGLRYEALEDINFDEYTPFLNTIRRHYGTWGISYTRVPTESRPGHIAVFGGMYEDPSALLSGWKNNPINVDNVFNQSIESWLWGSPDIVPMFNRDNLKKINTFSYDASFEDFTGRVSTIELDKWVFKNVKEYLSNIHIERLLGSGKIFFLHLLGMDTVGHIFKPNSREYINNLKYIDDGIGEIHNLFEEFFPDNRTSYIFTSDHGMTDWGSHGSGSDHETQSPFIAWGSGFEHQRNPYNLHQADIAPLISILLGINIPTNSVGFVPYDCLNTTADREVFILYINMRQLAERYNRKNDRIQRATVYGFFKPFERLNKEIFDRRIGRIEDNIINGFYDVAKEDILDLVKLVQEGDKYINRCYKYPFLFALSLGIVFWMLYLVLHVTPSNETNLITPKFISRCLMNYILVLLGLGVALQYHGIQTKYQFYLFFPCLTVIPVLCELNQLIYVVIFLRNIAKLQLFLRIMFCTLGFSSLIFSFYYESYIIFPIIFLLLWILMNRSYYKNEDICLWMILPLLIFLYPLFSKITKDYSSLQTIASYFITSYVLLVRIRNVSNEIKQKIKPNRASYYYVLNIYLILTTASSLIAMVYPIFGITNEFWQMIICLGSWFILGASLILAILSPSIFINRIFDVSVLFHIIFITMSNSGESLFLTLFICFQLQWVFLELYRIDKQFEGEKRIQYLQAEANYDDFRRCMFFIYFILLSYFGAGNSANMNTFDPMWARQFVMVFNPFLSAIIILLKITIPFLITTVSFQTINAYTDTPTIKLFSIIMLYCDFLVIYFMYSIRNEGSWLHIGLSISRFIIVSLMTIVLLLFYGIAKFLTRNTLFNTLTIYFRGEKQFKYSEFINL